MRLGIAEEPKPNIRVDYAIGNPFVDFANWILNELS